MPKEGTYLSEVHVGGSAQKGPFAAGAVVHAVYVDPRGRAAPEEFETETTNDLGDFSLDLPALGILSLVATGRYYAEALGRLSNAPISLRAYRSVSKDDAAVHINAVTDLTFDRVS